jgi:hypothetical protein
MQTFNDLKAAPKRLEREMNEQRTRQLREMVRELIEDRQRVIKILRKFDN